MKLFDYMRYEELLLSKKEFLTEENINIRPFFFNLITLKIF